MNTHPIHTEEPHPEVPRLPLSRMWPIALALLDKLTPFCEPGKVQVAGSIRRGRPMVGDIDLVVVAKDPAVLQERCAGRWHTITSGEQNCIYTTRLSDSTLIQIDIFFAKPLLIVKDLLSEVGTPSNFGSLLLCRTGSKEHNIYLIEHAKRMGLRWNPYSGVFRGSQLIASETEEEIFKALGLDFVPPQRRER